MSQYENPVALRISFTAPDPTHVVLQGPALAAFRTWQESGDDADHEVFMDCLFEQVEDHVAQWTMIEEWNYDGA